jgi:hypothetical protein
MCILCCGRVAVIRGRAEMSRSLLIAATPTGFIDETTFLFFLFIIRVSPICFRSLCICPRVQHNWSSLGDMINIAKLRNKHEYSSQAKPSIAVHPPRTIHAACINMVQLIRDTGVFSDSWVQHVQTLVPYFATPWGLQNLADSYLNGEMYYLCATNVLAYARGEISEDQLRLLNPHLPDNVRNKKHHARCRAAYETIPLQAAQ